MPYQTFLGLAGPARSRYAPPAVCRFAVALAVAGLLAYFSTVPAAAQSASAAGAESLFNEGRRLMDAGEFAAACDKFEASHALEPSVGALLNLGDCREKNGEIASAWVAYRQAATIARRDNDRRRRSFATERATQLEPRLSYVTLQVAEERAADLQISLDGEPMAEPLWGQRLPVNVGEHKIDITAPGHVPERLTFVVTREGEMVDVVIPALEEIPMPDGTASPGADTADELMSRTGGNDLASTSRPIMRPVNNDGGLSSGRFIAIGSGVVGLAGVATGVVFALRSQDKWQKAQDSHCNELNECDSKGLELAEEATDAATVSNLSYAVGAAFLVGGVAMWLLSPSSSGPESVARTSDSNRDPTTTLIPMLGPDRAGFTLRRNF